MRNLYFAALLLISFNVSAQSKLLPMSELPPMSTPPPMHPVTNSTDRSKPGIVWKGNKAYLTHPGTDSPDYSKPVYIRDSSGSRALKPISKN